MTTPGGFPCCVRFPCVRAAATTPVRRLGVVFAHITQPCQPSPGHRVGPHIGIFEACSAFTRVAARTLAPSPKCDLLHRRLQPFRHLHDCSGCFRLERFAGWDSHPLESARRTPFAALPDQPGTGGEHQKAGVGRTRRLRQERPFPKQATNASIRPLCGRLAAAITAATSR